jgi:acetyl-CoA synthetase
MIKARIKAQNPEANLRNYDYTYKSFSWSEVGKAFSWQQDKMNIAHEAIDRWANNPEKQEHHALIFEKAGETRSYTYGDLKEISSQWANLLVDYGFKTGDRLFIFLPPCPEIYFAMLGCARLGVLFCPLFSTLGYDELEERLVSATPRGIITDRDFAERLPPEAMSAVNHVFLIRGPLSRMFRGEVLLEGLPEKQSKHFSTRYLQGNTPLYLLFTSGSTGPPKGVVHAHHDMVGHLATGRYVLDLREDSVIWTHGDPAWVTGTVYGAFSTWLCGACSVVQADPFSASTWYRTLEKNGVSVWYETPGTIRKLKEAGEDLPHRYDFRHLRHIATVGETLTPELLYWVKKNFKLTPHDTWWMTETGMICIANFLSMDIKPGSMGKPVPGVEASVIDERGEPLPALSMGELALRPGWPAMMTDIWQDRDRYREYFRLNGWFRTGDMVMKDEEGYYYHQGRNDDLIKVGVKLIGPYEIERALCQHPAVNEAAVISRSQKTGEPHVKAIVTINKGFVASARMNQEIKAFVKASLSEEITLKEIEFMEEIPKTRSGKILRRVLRTRELGLPIGDPLKIKED